MFGTDTSKVTFFGVGCLCVSEQDKKPSLQKKALLAWAMSSTSCSQPSFSSASEEEIPISYFQLSFFRQALKLHARKCTKPQECRLGSEDISSVNFSIYTPVIMNAEISGGISLEYFTIVANKVSVNSITNPLGTW